VHAVDLICPSSGRLHYFNNISVPTNILCAFQRNNNTIMIIYYNVFFLFFLFITFLSVLLSGQIDPLNLLSCINLKIPALTTRNNYPFYIPVCNTNYAANEPLVRMMRIANTEPSNSSN